MFVYYVELRAKSPLEKKEKKDAARLVVHGAHRACVFMPRAQLLVLGRQATLFDMDSAYRHSGTKWGASKNKTTSLICVATLPLLVRFTPFPLLFGEP